MKRWLILSSCVVWMIPAALAAPVPLKTTEFGRGPTIVMLHGMGGARAAWMPTARKLLGAHRVVMMDLPGHGDSPLPDPFSLENAAESVAASLAAYKPESTIVVGNGVGGLLAILAASAHPERMRGVVVIDAGLRSETTIPDQQQQQFLGMLDANYAEFLKMIFTRMGRDSAQGVLIHAQASQVPAATIKVYLRELLKIDAARAMKTLKPQFLYLGTEKNWPADKTWGAIARARGYEDSTRAARRVLASGPLIATEQPDTLAAILAAFSRQALAKK